MRAKINLDLLFRSARHPAVIEEVGGSTESLGLVARSVIRFEVGVPNLYRLLAPSDLEADSRGINDLLASFFLDRPTTSELGLPVVENGLGNVIREYHRFFEQKGHTNLAWLERDPIPWEVLERGLTKALDGQAEAAETLLPAFRREAREFFLS